MVLQQLKALLLGFIGGLVRLFRRALCCFSTRRRKPSFSSEPIEINVVVEPNYNCQQTRQQQPAERDWNSWDDSPRTVSEHIEQYRQRLARPPTPPPAEHEPDLFSELAPVIKPQPKFYLGNDSKDKVNFSRLEAKVDVPITMNADLEDWADEAADGGWEEIDSEQTKQMIRDKRREMRNQRQRSAKETSMEAQSPKQSISGAFATRLTTTAGMAEHSYRSHT